MYPLVLTFQPAGKGFGHICQAGDPSGAEEACLDELDRVLYRSLAFRIRLVADPEVQFLLLTELPECFRLYDFPICFGVDEDGILVYHQGVRATSDLAETPVDGPAGFLGIELVVLCKHVKVPAVSQQEADEVDFPIASFRSDLTEVNQHLLSGRSVHDELVGPFACFKNQELFGDVKFAVWYIRIRDKSKTRTAFDGIVKVEKMLITHEENEYGIDSELVDLLSSSIINERNPVCYGSDLRWANHLYPIYLTELYVKSKYLSTESFLNLF